MLRQLFFQVVGKRWDSEDFRFSATLVSQPTQAYAFVVQSAPGHAGIERVVGETCEARREGWV